MTFADPQAPAIMVGSAACPEADAAAATASSEAAASYDDVGALSRSSSRTMQDRAVPVAAPPAVAAVTLPVLAAPCRPELKPEAWRRFIAAYRTGNWEAASQVAEAKDRTPTIAGPPPFRPCSVRDGKVLCPQGNLIDSLDFYKTYGFFAPPPPIPADMKRRKAALRRHGFTKPQGRACLDRYVKHAKTILNADFAAVTVACTDENFMLHLSRLGGNPDDDQPIASHTICSHAALLGDHDLFIVPDIASDWRFRDFHFTDCEGEELRSYASAPVLVTAPPDLSETEWTLEDDSLFETLANDERDDADSLVSVGRLTIMKRGAWEPTEAEASLLRDVAQMCGEAIDNDWQKQNRMRLKRMQAQTAKLARLIETEDGPSWDNSRPSSALLAAQASSEDAGAAPSPSTADSAASAGMFTHITQVDERTLRIVESISESMVEVLDADAISVVDVTSLRFAPLRRSGPEMERPAMAGREGSSGSFYPSTPWLQSPSPSSAKRVEAEMALAASSSGSRSGHATPPMGRSGSRTSIKSASEHSYEASASGDGSASSVLDSPLLTRPSLHSSSESPSVSTSSHKRSASSFHAGPDELDCWLETTQGPRLVVHHGEDKLKPVLEGNTSKAIIVSYLKERRNQLRIRPTPTLFFSTPVGGDDQGAASAEGSRKSPSGIEDDDDGQDPSHPLSLLMPRVTRPKSHLCIPIYDIEEQPLYLLLATIDADRIIEGGDVIFASACAAILYASRLRHRAQQADRAQLDFLRSVSHEMRTPLNAIVGITDFIRQGMMPDAESSSPVDLSEDGVLASMLESIRLAGSSLTSTLDDVLDLGAMSGVRSANRGQRIEQVNLRREIEEVCLDELEHVNLKLRQDHRLQNDRLLISGKLTAGPTLVINVATDLPKLWRADRSALRKILAKVVSNALRFTREDGLVEVSVRLRSSNRDASASSGTREVLFSISDNGIGMSKAFVRTQLLSPFAKGDSFTQGVGLGATIAASLTARLGGRFDVESELGQGTRVRVTLPLTAVAGRDSLQSPLEAGSSTSSSQSPILRVRNAFFQGFDSPSLAKVHDLVRRRLYEHGVRSVSSLSQADVAVFHEDSVASSPALPPFKSRGAPARIVIVTDSIWGGPEARERLVGYPVHLFRPPYGPTGLDSMVSFLSQEEPLILAMPVAKSQADVETPQAAPSSAEAASQTTEPKVEPAGEDVPDDKTFKVLVVEDNPLNMKLLTAVLSKLNIHYEEAHDGIEAVEKYRRYRPSVVLLDISLPLQDGFAACSLMRAHPLGHSPRIVAVTALSSHEDKARGIALGMNEWRTKPVSIKAIRADLVGWQDEWRRAVGDGVDEA